MVLLKMLMEMALPKMGDLLVMTMMVISPSRREVPPAESLRRRAKVLQPKFPLAGAALRAESPLIFLGQNDLYTKRWALEVGQGGHNPPGSAWGPGVPWCLVLTRVAPSGSYLLQYFHIFQNNSP